MNRATIAECCPLINRALLGRATPKAPAWQIAVSGAKLHACARALIFYPLQEFHLGEWFLLRHFRRHSVRQPYRLSENLVGNVLGYRGIKVARPQSLPRELNMTTSPTRESPAQTNTKLQPHSRNVYDYDGEYEFPTAQHWTASSERSHNTRSKN
jgi:hypothetical protein